MTDPISAAYAAVSLFSQRMRPDVVLPLLRVLGDTRLIDDFSGCFGKQRYSEFMEAAKQAAFDVKLQFVNGYDPKKVPKDDAFTVLDLLRVLAGDEENRILLDSKDFKYSRIGRGRVDSSEVLNAEEQAEIQKLTEEMSKTRDAKKIKELTDRIAAVTANKAPALKFEADKNEDGYPISSLTYNEERPNVSFLVRKTGKVDISGRTKGQPTLEKIPGVMDTFIFRNYTVVKDGLVNLERLPVKLTAGTIRALKDQGMPIETITGVDGETAEEARVRAAKASNGRSVAVVFDLKNLPIINRNMVKQASAKKLFELEYDLCKARAAQKVYNTYKKERFPRKSEGFAELYGKEQADWLKDQGLTDYSGFSPKSVQAEATDFYMSKVQKVSLKGLSSLPSLKEAKEKMTKGKLTPSAALMAPYVKEVEDFLDSATYKNSTKQDALFEGWLDGQQKTATKKVRELLFQTAQIRFGVIVGQVWFSEFSSLDQTTLTIDIDGQKLEGKVEMKEVEEKV